MSIRLMALVWEYQFTRPEQSIMLALADHAQDDGTQVFPSVGRIAWKTDYSERQVQRIMRDLEAKGILAPVKHVDGGRGHATEYSIHLEKGVKKSPFIAKGDRVSKKGDIPDGKGDVRSTKGDVIVSPEPSLESPLESSRNQDAPPVSLRSTSPTGERVPPIPMGVETEGQRNARLASERQRDGLKKARMR